jgi:hypothetical protein
MKKILFLSFIFGAIVSTNIHAQTGPQASKPQTSNTPPAYDPAAMLQQMKKIVPQMVEKTGLTEAQANRVIELNFEMRQAAGALDPNDADRSKKIAELKAAKEKKMSELLTAEQILAVKNFYEEMGKNMAPKSN